MYDEWLRNEKGYVPETMTIRKSTALNPKVAIEHYVTRRSFAYPHEETGYTYTELVQEYEDLEFQLGNRKCGFWFNPRSNEFDLLKDFKNMFNTLHNDK